MTTQPEYEQRPFIALPLALLKLLWRAEELGSPGSSRRVPGLYWHRILDHAGNMGTK